VPAAATSWVAWRAHYPRKREKGGTFPQSLPVCAPTLPKEETRIQNLSIGHLILVGCRARRRPPDEAKRAMVQIRASITEHFSLRLH
jgi:hypothetical protein